jgi:cytosine/adenosine deaminase-related metal-dependent hydrolase
MTGRLVVRNGRVLTLDPALGELARADVLVENGLIRDIRPGLRVDDAEDLDVAGMLVSPGFVDVHRHVWQTQLRTLAVDWTLFDYTCRTRFGYAALYEPDDVWLGNHVGALEALDAGITTLVDHCHVMNSPEHADEAVRGLADAGIRGVFCYGLFPNPTLDPYHVDLEPGWRLDDARRVRARHFPSDDARLVMGLAPREVTAIPFEATCAELRFGRELGARRISCHVAMGLYDRGDRLVGRLADAGMLGDDVLLVHGAALADDELRAVALAGAAVAVTPETELQMGMGRPLTVRGPEFGVRAGLGVDVVSGASADMFGQMRLALQAERAMRHEHAAGPPRRLDVSARRVLELATRGGAEALGLEHRIGRLALGTRADLICTRTDAVGMVPATDAVGTLVLNATARDVDTVIVDGRVVKRGGALVGVDWARLSARLAASSRRITEAFAAIPLAQVEAVVGRVLLREG